MLHLKFYKPLIGLLHKDVVKQNTILYNIKKDTKVKSSLNPLTQNFLIWSGKVCFFTHRYKTQLNVLHQSRFQLRHTLTFNKDHTWRKYTH